MKRVKRFKELFDAYQPYAYCLLYEWIKTGVLDHASAIECFHYIRAKA